MSEFQVDFLPNTSIFLNSKTVIYFFSVERDGFSFIFSCLHGKYFKTSLLFKSNKSNVFYNVIQKHVFSGKNLNFGVWRRDIIAEHFSENHFVFILTWPTVLIKYTFCLPPIDHHSKRFGIPFKENYQLKVDWKTWFLFLNKYIKKIIIKTSKLYAHLTISSRELSVSLQPDNCNVHLIIVTNCQQFRTTNVSSYWILGVRQSYKISYMYIHLNNY